MREMKNSTVTGISPKPRSFLSYRKHRNEKLEKVSKPKGFVKQLTMLSISILLVATIVSYSYAKSNESPESDILSKERLLQEEAQIQYSNVKDRSFLMSYPKDGPVIAILLAGTKKDVQGCCIALKSLGFIGGDREHPAPVLIFNEGDISEEEKNFVTSCTKRPIAFPIVEFKEMPEGFNEEVISKKYVVEGRKEWGYYHMIRFWVTEIWKHPALIRYETVMRLDTDSCFKEKNDLLPNFKYNDLVYHSQFVGIENDVQYAEGLFQFAEAFFKEIGRFPASPMLWDFVKLSSQVHNSIPVFSTNFELIRKSFMLHPDVMLWHESLTEKEPFGVFRYRWSVNTIRFLTAVMFASNDRIMMSHPTGYYHQDDCPKSVEEMEKLLLGPELVSQ